MCAGRGLDSTAEGLSPLLAWRAEQVALCWVNLLVSIWSIQLFLPAACYLVFSADFSVWTLPFLCCCLLTGCFPLQSCRSPRLGCLQAGVQPRAALPPREFGQLYHWGLCNFCNLKAKNGPDFSMKVGFY